MIRLPGSRRAVLAALTLAVGPATAADAPGWPYTPPAAPPPPPVRRTDWVRNPVDWFVLAKLEAVGLTPAPEADRLTLLKRVTHDLTGLAPTPEERAAFLADPSPDAYEKAVDRLLASPHFGERWAQHWLDLARYSETDGFKTDRHRPDAWRYRDYVIRAFNADLPYDRFLRQQIAGDELEPENPDALVATGFLRQYPEDTVASDYRQVRQDILNDVTDTFGLVTMGLTVGCARCHNHKADPVTQADYFALQAFFAPMVPRDDAVALAPAALADYREQLAAWQAATKPTRDAIDAMLKPYREAVAGEVIGSLDPETQRALRTPEPQRSPVQRQLARLGGKQVGRRTARADRRLTADQKARYDDLLKKLASFDGLKPAAPPTAMAVCDVGCDAPLTHRLGGGSLDRPKEPVSPAFPAVFGGPAPRIVPPPAQPESTGRRAALAGWVTRPDHPLTARVAVNRLWHHHLGRGIVATPSDFGEFGGDPSHPELLDFLATELVRRNWSLKAIHRLIVTSATYRMRSSEFGTRREDLAAAAAGIGGPVFSLPHAASRTANADERLLWRARVKRRDGEAVRDAALQAADALNPTMFGPSCRPVLPAALADARSAWSPDDDPAARNRRSVYVYHSRNLPYPLFQAFDAPGRMESCPARPATTSPVQALVMLNGEFLNEQARLAAGRVLASAKPGAPAVRAAYLRLFGRDPSADELSAGEAFLKSQARTILAEGPPASDTLPTPPPHDVSAPDAAAVVDLVHALMNTAEFLYVE